MTSRTISLKEKARITLNLIRLFIADTEGLCSDDEDIADRLLCVLRTYEADLVRHTEDKLTTFDELLDMKEAIRETNELLYDLAESEAQMMQGWHHGITPRNSAQHVANVLSEIHLELSKATLAQEELYPELKFAFDRIRQRQAAGLPLR